MVTIQDRANRLGPQLVAEFLGTFALVFFGCASMIVSGGSLVTIALAHGLILAVGVAGAVYISGGQFNPAVSLGLVIAEKQTLAKAGAFIVTQVFAAATAAGMLLLFLGRSVADNPALGTELGATIGSLTRAGNTAGVFGFEFISTFALMYVILAAAVDRRSFQSIGPLAIGATLAAAILACGPLTGAALNPARAFGPALYGHWTMHWVYWVAPICGACSAAAVYRLCGVREVER